MSGFLAGAAGGAVVHFHGSVADDPWGHSLGATLQRIEGGFGDDQAAALRRILPERGVLLVVGYSGSDTAIAALPPGALERVRVVWVCHSDHTWHPVAPGGPGSPPLTELRRAGTRVDLVCGPTGDLIGEIARRWGMADVGPAAARTPWVPVIAGDDMRPQVDSGIHPRKHGWIRQSTSGADGPRRAVTLADIKSARRAIAGTAAASLPIGLLEYNMNGLQQPDGAWGLPAQGTIAGAVYVALLLTQAFTSDARFTMGGLWDLVADSNYGVIGNAREKSSHRAIDGQGWYLRQATRLMPGQQVHGTTTGHVSTTASLARVLLPPQSVVILNGQRDNSRDG